MKSFKVAAASLLAICILMGGCRIDLDTSETAQGELVDRILASGRPRLFLQRDELDELREQIQTTHGEKWKALKAAVDKSLSEAPPEYQEPRVGGDSTRPGTLNDEMLWQRQFGYKLPGMALVALLDDDERYFELVRRWVMRPGEYPLWGAGIYENTGLAAKHQLFGMAVAYDWLHDRWSGEDRESILRTLREHGRILYEAAEGINDRGWWRHEWRQNHAWNGYQALAVTAIAVAGEEPDAGLWLAKAVWGGKNIIAELPDEGAYEEGLPYWGYGMEALMRFVEATQPYINEDFYSFDYFRNTYLFRLYLAGPDVEQIANFGDGRTTDWHAMQPILYRLASEYENPATQWLAESLPHRPDIDATCWGLLWFDAGLEPRMPEHQPLSQVFKETGFAGARTSWTTDAVALHLRSGRAHVSHSHLDVSNFLINRDGEWLLRDYGYGRVGPGYFNKETIYFSTGTPGHNCLVINEAHQRKDGASAGFITDAVDTGEMVWWRSDATTCYEGAESVVREFILLRPSPEEGGAGWIVIRDRARMTHPSRFDFMLQPGGTVEIEKTGFQITSANGKLVGVVIEPEEAVLELVKDFGERLNVDDALSLKISNPGQAQAAEFLVVFAALSLEQSVPEVTKSSSGLQVGGHRLSFSPDGRTAPKHVLNRK